jgi:short-subunit dehydrogenase
VFARKLAQRGYDLILVARRREKLEQLANELVTQVDVIEADLTREDSLCASEAAIRGCDRLDLLVNNAGFGTLGRFWQGNLAGQQQMHQLHVMATMRLTHAALQGMTARDRGAVINVASVAAFSYSPGNVSYCATKAWMNLFSEGLDNELRKSGSKVRVQSLCPGYTYTEFHDTLGVDRARIPRFLWMKAEDVVDASLSGLERGAPLVVPGWIYKVTVAALRILPPWVHRRMGRPFGGKRV